MPNWCIKNKLEKLKEAKRVLSSSDGIRFNDQFINREKDVVSA